MTVHQVHNVVYRYPPRQRRGPMAVRRHPNTGYHAPAVPLLELAVYITVVCAVIIGLLAVL